MHQQAATAATQQSRDYLMDILLHRHHPSVASV